MKLLLTLIIGMYALSGCCSVKNLPDYIAGTYVNQPEAGTGGRYIKTFDYPYHTCFERSEAILEGMGASIRYKSKRKHKILAWYFDKIYDTCIDTTKVGVYFKELSPQKTQVDVACGNYGLAKFVSDELFKELEKPTQ